MRIFSMMSIYDEEHDMLNSAINSCSDLDEIFVFDGPTDHEKVTKNRMLVGPVDKETDKGIPYNYFHGYWSSDADKRTTIIKTIKNIHYQSDNWGLWLDGDEILLYGEYLRDHCNRASHETSAGGTTIRIVEYDGSVAQCYGKLIKLGAISRYIMSSYEVELRSGMTVALPNVPICTAGGIPLVGEGESTDRDSPIWALKRPPLIGEPHLLHRHGLRNPERTAPRLHDKEAEDFAQMVNIDIKENL